LITVYVKAFTGVTEVSVYDILGQLRLHKTLDKSRTGIDISGLSKGVYLVGMVGKNGYTMRKVVKD
jgi:hypothetical protein